MMPAVKTVGIKKAIIQYVEGNRKAVSRYTIRSSSGHVESFNLVILPNQKPAKPNLTDQYVVFATKKRWEPLAESKERGVKLSFLQDALHVCECDVSLNGRFLVFKCVGTTIIFCSSS